jgi:quercetin dioxygenase-like cupin family protein
VARVLTQSEAKHLALPGRKSLEIVSAEMGSQAVTLRLVEVPVSKPGEPLRGPHRHPGFEECIFVLAGVGCTETDTGSHLLKEGDTILISPGEMHVTRNTGSAPLLLLCFFPVADISGGTQDHPSK